MKNQSFRRPSTRRPSKAQYLAAMGAAMQKHGITESDPVFSVFIHGIKPVMQKQS